jgi:squalene-hopene/tetraprenyl-beta-curcumene cyclase
MTDVKEKKSSVLRAEAVRAVNLATKYAKDNVHDDGHWLGPMSSDVTITAEWLFLLQSIGREINGKDNESYRYHFLSSQEEDGSWAVAPRYPYGGNLSATIEAYLALKILGVSPDDPAMRKAREYILKHGGAEKMRIFTRFHFAMFGLLPWQAVPQMPPELILLPSWFPINLYKFSSWSRITIVPFLIIRVHEPIYSLPNGLARHDNDFLDELWIDPTSKNVPYTKPFLNLLYKNWVALLFQVADTFLWILCLLNLTPFRRWALATCTTWLLDRQEVSGDWAGIFPPMHLSIYALLLQGYSLESDPVQRGLVALDRFCFEDEKHGFWMQPCVSPVWDTFLMIRGLLDANTVDPQGKLVTQGLEWTKARQLFLKDGDWRVYRPTLEPGGWSFEYDNSFYPDVDDTAAGILSFLKHDPEQVYSRHVLRAAIWILGMQNADGGWAAFDVNNDALFLNSIPFSDMEALCDLSCPDIVGRVLEAFGLMLKIHRNSSEKQQICENALFDSIELSCKYGLAYLDRTQESFGGWFGRWGTNYIYGTSNVLCGLAYFTELQKVEQIIPPALRWLESVQNPDGGWGERLDSYVDITRAGKGESTPSQTAWALMGIIAHSKPAVESVIKGVQWLVSRQQLRKSASTQSGKGEVGVAHSGSGTWDQEEHTGTGFPGHFYLGYDLYRHYFPMMALGRYIRAVDSPQ